MPFFFEAKEFATRVRLVVCDGTLAAPTTCPHPLPLQEGVHRVYESPKASGEDVERAFQRVIEAERALLLQNGRTLGKDGKEVF